MQRKANVVIVNDSPYFLSLLESIVKDKHNVYAKFTSAYSTLKFISSVDDVDVILLDLELPDMDGITLLERILSIRHIPIIVTTAYEHSWLAEKVISTGAVEFMSISSNVSDLYSLVMAKIEYALMLKDFNTVNRMRSSSRYSRGQKVVVIGASTGAPSIVADILAALPSDADACIMVVQHLAKGFIDYYAKMLRDRARIRVKVAEDNDRIVNGLALIAPPDYHMVVEDGYIRLWQGPKYAYVRPSINVTMVTAAKHYGPNVIGVLLSGMGFDGALGMKVIKAYNGVTIAQDKSTSAVYGMASVASNGNAVDTFAPAGRIAEEIIKALRVMVMR